MVLVAQGQATAGGMIEIDSLDVRFGAFHAVRTASFRVGAGEAFGLVGESGSGKTTVLKAIAGLITDWGAGSRSTARCWARAAAPPSTARCR